MKGLLPLFLGLFGTFAFSWVGLILVPNLQIGHLDPQMDEEGTDIYPMPQSGMVERGRRVYVANGCAYCHSEQLRPDYAASDIDRKRDLEPHPKWGERRSAPRDYIFARPVVLGKERMGPDLANIGKAAPAEQESPAPAASASPASSPAQTPPVNPAQAPSAAPAPAAAKNSPAPANVASPPAGSPATSTSPGSAPPKTSAPPAATSSPQTAAPNATAAASASPVASLVTAETKTGALRPYSTAWHHQHLYSPRSINLDSNMPAFRFLYEKRQISSEASSDALKLTGSDAPAEGWEIVPTYEARCLVAYLMSLDQSHPLKEVKTATAAPASAASPATSPAASPPPK